MPLPAAKAATVTLAWDQNNEPDIAGYRLHYGTSSEPYDNTRDVGNSTTYTVSNLTEGTTYYFAVTAYDTSGLESGFSEEVVHTIAFQNRQPNKPAVPSGPSSGYPNTGYNYTTTASDPDDDLLDYRFNWGDGVISTWGAASRSHSWSSTGAYCVKAQARDSSGAASSWSDCKDINIAVNTHSITASTDTHGTISPSGDITVNDGASQTFSIIPDQGYTVSDIRVDDVSVGVTTSYTFRNVTRNHTIFATFASANQAPKANAGADQSARVNDTVTLDGSGSSDADGDTLTFKWSFASRPDGSSAALSSTTKVNPTFVVDAPGNYVVRLIVNDGKTASQPDTVTISTQNSAPVASAGPDQSVKVNDTVTLDGSGSGDADSDSLTFKWSFVSRPSGSNAALSSTTATKPNFVVDVPGNYVVQLIVNDGKTASQPDNVTISTQNSAPVAAAGEDQTVEEGGIVTLSGAGSFDPDENIVSYSWNQTNGKAAKLTEVNLTDVTFTAPEVDTDGVALTFQLTVRDSKALQGIDSCVVYVNNAAVRDGDSDGVPDDQDVFPSDPTETSDSDNDGIGNNADPDDDNDQMPDEWEIQYGLDPLLDDAAEDADLDGISNLDEFLADSNPIVPKGNSAPDSPVLISPSGQKSVTLTPLLQTDDFYDPDFGDFHSETQWQVFRQADNVCVLDVLSPNSLNSLQVPKAVLTEKTRYAWKAKFFDGNGAASDWSEPAIFVTGTSGEDSNGNGIPDDQETDYTSDMNEDGILDADQETIKCVNTKGKKSQVGISFEGSDTVSAIEYLAYLDPKSLDDSPGKPNNFPFGMLDFRLRVAEPGDEAVVTVHFSGKTSKNAKWYKYNPIEKLWVDYSAYTDPGANKKSISLRLQDGGMGDADGIANGIIVDPSGLSADLSGESVSSDGGDADSNGSNSSCFISATVNGSSIYPETTFLRQLTYAAVAIILILLILTASGRRISNRLPSR